MLYPDINSQKKTQQNTTRYRTALYLRLSREDGDKTESDSIANQRTLLEAYAADHPELCIVDEFVDDGYSGSNFERPAFQRLFQELEQGAVNCVLVKDLSRFGRNYIEVGRYLERIFPVMRVRLIAVTDNYDSQSAWKTSDSIMVPMRNLLNDAYCRDISVKIKSQLVVKRKRGDFVGSFATYGYRKDPTNHSKLIVDELAAENVQSIFRWKISGMSNQGIADRLNARKVPSPATRKLQSGAKLSLHFRKSDEPPWSAKAVDRILHNEVYIGKLVQGKTRRLDYRSKKKMNVRCGTGQSWTIPMKQSFRQSSLNWCGGFWKPKHAGRTMPKRWPCLRAFSTVGIAAAGWCAGRPAIRESGISIISALAANRTKAVARAIICGMKNSITSCGTRFRCRFKS